MVRALVMVIVVGAGVPAVAGKKSAAGDGGSTRIKRLRTSISDGIGRHVGTGIEPLNLEALAPAKPAHGQRSSRADGLLRAGAVTLATGVGAAAGATCVGAICAWVTMSPRRKSGLGRTALWGVGGATLAWLTGAGPEHWPLVHAIGDYAMHLDPGAGPVLHGLVAGAMTRFTLWTGFGATVGAATGGLAVLAEAID
jgi:hypothetical protein